MKLPILLLGLVAISQAQPVELITNKTEAKDIETKSSPVKSPEAKESLDKTTVAKQEEENQTTKRELYEGNFGERKKEFSPKYEATSPPPPPKIMYTTELQDMVSDAHQIFGVRLPQISKISDVLSEQNPGSYEAAVAKHLYSPVSVYHARVSSPTSFEIPAPEASQSAYSNPKKYKLQKSSEKEQSQHEVAPNAMELPNRPLSLYTVNQPRIRYGPYPQDLIVPQVLFQQRQGPRKSMPLLFPIYDQLGPFRHPGQVVPSQLLHQNGLFHVISVTPDFAPSNQVGNSGNNDPNQENNEQSTAERTQPQIDTPVHKNGYHAHPNGAISFASFSQKLPINAQYDAPQPQINSLHHSQLEQLQSQPIPVQLPPQIEPKALLQSQDLKQQAKQNLQFPMMFQKLLQDLEKYQPVFQQQSQHIPFKIQIQNQPRPLNSLQQHLLHKDSKHLPNSQVIPLYRLPSFKPLPQSLLTSKPFLQHTSRSPLFSNRLPRPLSFEHQSPTQENYDRPLVSTQITQLPPLKPNYSKYVRPLEPQSHTTPVFLPTPLQPLPSSTPKQDLVADQLISSTTIQPNVKDKKESEKQAIQEDTQPQSQISQPLKPEIIHQAEPTVGSQAIQSTTYLPFVTKGPQSIHFQYSTPQPQYQQAITLQSTKTPPRHDVVIQRQEIQELFFEPSPHPSSQFTTQNERELLQLKSEPHHQLYEQLQPLSYHREIQDINTQQYLLEARQLQQNPDLREPQQYLIQQHSHPLQLLQFQPELLQVPQPELEQSQQQQQVSNQAQYQQQHESEQGHYQQQVSNAAEQQQQAAEPTQYQQQVSNEAQQQTEAGQAQQPQQESEQAQQQQPELEQAQTQHEAEQSQQQQYQQQHLDSNNQIQISTLKPSEDTEKQTETVEIEQQTESHSTTRKPNEQSDIASKPIPYEEQLYLEPLLTPSVIPQKYAHEQQLVAQPEYNPLSSVPSYSDVQYFGKFAEKLFGNHHH